MTFSELSVGDIFKSVHGYNYEVTQDIGLEFNVRCLDTGKLYLFSYDEIVELDESRTEFERQWVSYKKPIDKSLCYEFYQLGRTVNDN